jgi:cold shock CspA family protein/ribosome-associated translation inhibitor RaiA
MEIHWAHLSDLNPELRAAIEARLQRLAEGHNDLIDVRIGGQAGRHHRHGGHSVRITCQARGQQIVATRERAELGLALNEVLDDFEREVLELRRIRREARSERPRLPPHLGVIDRVFRGAGYGFVLTDEGTQVYFHRNAVHGRLQFESLEEGQRVALNIEPGEQGPQATTLVAPPPDTPAP